MIKWLRLVVLIFCLNLQAQAQFTSVNFSIQAHADDWQLFWPTRTIADMSVANSKMVFITITAGDASAGTAAYGGGGPFYLSREIGAMYSSKFAADLTTGTAPTDLPAEQVVTINGNTVSKYVYKNTVNYFLHLPDGSTSGAGFGNNNNQSLYKLRNSTIPQSPQISSINTIGNTGGGAPANLTYSWSELVATVRQIINDERIPGTQSWIHTPHINTTTFNINDHSDHTHAGYIAQAAVASGMSWVGYTGFMDYASSSQPANLSETAQANAAILFGLETLSMSEQQYQNDFAPDAYHLSWLPMDSFLVIRVPSGTAPTGPVGPPAEELNTDKSLTRIPMITSITSPVYINKDLSMYVTPYETGQLRTVLYDMSGKIIYQQETVVSNKNLLTVTLPSPIKAKGTYSIETILNNKFIETRKIVVE